MTLKTLTTQEIADFLGVTRQGLKKMIASGNFEGKLLEKNYKFIKSEKQGRKVVYFIEEICIVPKEEWEVYMKREFPNVRKVSEYGDYCEERLVNNKVIAKEISKNVGVSAQTLVRWDDMLVRKGVISDNGYSYFHIKNKQSKPVQITYGEYLQYWKDLSRISAEEEQLLNIIDDEITSRELHMTLEGTCIKVKSYLVNEFTDAYENLVSALEGRKGRR